MHRKTACPSWPRAPDTLRAPLRMPAGLWPRGRQQMGSCQQSQAPSVPSGLRKAVGCLWRSWLDCACPVPAPLRQELCSSVLGCRTG